MLNNIDLPNSLRNPSPINQREESRPLNVKPLAPNKNKRIESHSVQGQILNVQGRVPIQQEIIMMNLYEL
jgi:hypothetical protein